MEKVKFKVGDHLVPIESHKGVEDAIVIRIDDKNYYLKILYGTATIPITAQVNYKLAD